MTNGVAYLTAQILSPKKTLMVIRSSRFLLSDCDQSRFKKRSQIEMGRSVLSVFFVFHEILVAAFGIV